MTLPRLHAPSQRLRLYICLVLSLLAMLLWFIPEFFEITHSTFIAYCGDIALLTIPFWLIRKRWWLTLIPVWGLPIFLLANALNFRFWGDFLSFSAVTMAGNVGGLLINSIIGLLRLRDIVYLVIPAAFTLYFIIYRRKIKPDSIGTLRPVICSIALFLLGQAAVTRSSMRWKSITEHIPCGSFSDETIGRILPMSNRMRYMRSNGLTIYLLKNGLMFADDIFGRKDLTPEQRAEIDSFIQSYNRSELADSFNLNHDKNLIIVIVESLNADVINRTVNGFEITPTMNRLVGAEGSISTLHMIPQVKDGGSSDGQMMINTGLLPLRDGAAAMRFGSKNNFPSIVKELGFPHSVAVFGDDGAVWNQLDAFRSYGFDSVLSSRDFITPVDTRGRDGAMFDLALDTLRNHNGRFILECISNSMHIPFDEPAAEMPQAIANSNLSHAEKKYISVTNYFDRELGLFLDSIYKMSPAENTIVIITSDHCQALASGNNLTNKEETEIPVVFIAANTGYSARIDRISGQVNIYPTILDIMGVKYTKSGYRGLGKSLLNTELNGAVDVFDRPHAAPDSDAFKAIDISNDILKSDYFSK